MISHPSLCIKLGICYVEVIGICTAVYDDLILFLTSGGSSALLPLPPSAITLSDKQTLTDLLLKAGTFDVCDEPRMRGLFCRASAECARSKETWSFECRRRSGSDKEHPCDHPHPFTSTESVRV